MTSYASHEQVIHSHEDRTKRSPYSDSHAPRPALSTAQSRLLNPKLTRGGERGETLPVTSSW